MSLHLDEHGYLLNDPINYDILAHQMKFGAVIFPWTDGASAHTIWMNYGATAFGGRHGFASSSIGFGLQSECLYVSVARMGAFGFQVGDRPEDLHPKYVREKLDLSGEAVEEAALINGVIAALQSSGKPPRDVTRYV